MPTYNNAGTIAKVISDVKEYAADVIVVNDGSTDDTKDILSSISDIKVVDYPNNKGKGYALKLGLKKAYEWGFRYAITIDSDGQHYADDIPAFIEKIEEKPDSLLIGARNLTADNMPSKNTFANKFSNFWYKVETGQTLSDTQSGFRLYPLDYPTLRVRSRDYCACGMAWSECGKHSNQGLLSARRRACVSFQAIAGLYQNQYP